MKILAVVIAAIVIVGGVFFFSKSGSDSPATPSPSPSPTTQEINITASFTIITDSITRSFKAEKYHNQSSDVYITEKDPTQVHVKKTGITWSDFFETLPMEITRECLTTGDGETFCNKKDGTLKFYLNNVEDNELLDKKIGNGDSILIKFISD